MAGIKITPADKWFSKCVRERADWTCESCGAQYHEGNTRGLECSHYIRRAEHAVRHHPLNAFAHCTSCHMRLSPGDMYREYLRIFGEDDELYINQIRHNVLVGKLIKKHLPAVAKHYKGEHERMCDMRKDGHTGRLEFRGVLDVPEVLGMSESLGRYK